jgi:hypothetical protein
VRSLELSGEIGRAGFAQKKQFKLLIFKILDKNGQRAISH